MATRGPALTPELSLKLRALSLLGILMVVVGHSPSYRDPSAPNERSFGYAWVEALLTDAVPRIVVMMFFAVSGFLLLHGHDGTAATWRRKVLARTKSLAVPYLVWSAIGIGIYALLQVLPWTSMWLSSSPRRVLGRPWEDVLLIWLVDPVPYQLWFLRDLWLLVLLGPALAWALHRVGWVVIAVLLVPHLLDVHVPSPVAGIRLLTSDGYFWFAVGAWCGSRGVPPVAPGGVAVPLVAGTAVMTILRARGLALHAPGDVWWFKTTHLIGVPALWGVYDRWLRWLERPFWLAIAPFAFWVFAAHEPLMTMIKKPLIRVLGAGDLAHAIECAAALVGTLAGVLAIGWVVRRSMPRTFGFLCGGRG